VWQLARTFGELALRRRGPESLPDSTFLVGLLLAMSTLLSLVDLALYGFLAPRGLGNLVAQTALLFFYVFAVLSFFQLDRRYRRTMCAILGADIVIYLPFLVFALAGLAFRVDPTADLILGVRLAVFIWTVIVEASILARALSQPLVLGFMFAILYVVLSRSISVYLSPVAD
jgi:hypothetical protein